MTTFMNIQLAFPKKTVIAALVLLMLCLLSRKVTVLYKMVWAPKPAVAMASVTVPVAVRAPVVVASLPMKESANESAPSSELNGIALNSNFRSYHVMMNGQVVCGAKTCPAQLQVTMSSAQNPEMHQVVETNSDGSYEVAFAFRELPKEQVDWKVTAINDAMGTAETHGRQILTDDGNVELTTDNLEIHS